MFGLPLQVKFCTKCVISNQRPSSVVEHSSKISDKKPTIHFDAQGVCDACRWAEMKNNTVDWKQREKELKELLAKHRRKDGRYDVLVPGSGGKDSTFAGHILKYKYGMHPLTVTWAPHIYTEVGWRNYQHWIHSGFDNYLFNPNGKVHRQLTKLAFLNLLHPFQPFIFGQKNFAPKMAVKFNIPLVFFGENEAEYGNKIENNFSPFRDWPQVKTKDLYFGGVQMSELPKYGITKADLEPYLFPKKEELRQTGVEVRYLGYYLKWIPQEMYYYAVKHTGFEANPYGRTEGTYSKYNSLDDRIDGFHYYTTYIKFGLGRASYDAAQEIRSGHLTREEGMALVKRYDGEFPQRWFKEILNYMMITEKQFWQTIDKFRPSHLWTKKKGKWQLKHAVWMK
jgi:N-acetyl sugar amidotransferase